MVIENAVEQLNNTTLEQGESSVQETADATNTTQAAVNETPDGKETTAEKTTWTKEEVEAERKALEKKWQSVTGKQVNEWQSKYSTLEKTLKEKEAAIEIEKQTAVQAAQEKAERQKWIDDGVPEQVINSFFDERRRLATEASSHKATIAQIETARKDFETQVAEVNEKAKNNMLFDLFVTNELENGEEVSKNYEEFLKKYSKYQTPEAIENAILKDQLSKEKINSRRDGKVDSGIKDSKGVDTSSMTPEEKIEYGLSHPKNKK